VKVIQILPELNSGGVEKGTLELGNYLKHLGHESVVISNGGRLVDQLESEGSKHISLPVHKKRISSLRQIAILRKLFIDEQPDIVHLRSRLPAWLAYFAWKKIPQASRPRLVTTVHGFYSVNKYSKVMTKGERVICVSDSVRDYVLKNYQDVSPEKLRVIHRGVSPETLPYDFEPSTKWRSKWKAQHPHLDNKKLITLPGRITRWKGPLDFVKVIKVLKDKGLDVHGLLVGEAHPRKLEFLDEVKQAITAAGLDKDISIIGHRTDVREIMAISAAVVSCSTDPEAFGRVTLEALAMGRPVAGYNHGGVYEQLTKLLPEGQIPIGDTANMAETLSNWNQSPPAPSQVNPFILHSMLEKTIQTYNELLG